MASSIGDTAGVQRKVIVQQYRFIWVDYNGPNREDFFEGFCPIHSVRLMTCPECINVATPESPQLICTACEAEGRSVFHWRGEITNG